MTFYPTWEYRSNLLYLFFSIVVPPANFEGYIFFLPLSQIIYAIIFQDAKYSRSIFSKIKSTH